MLQFVWSVLMRMITHPKMFVFGEKEKEHERKKVFTTPAAFYVHSVLKRRILLFCHETKTLLKNHKSLEKFFWLRLDKLIKLVTFRIQEFRSTLDCIVNKLSQSWL